MQDYFFIYEVKVAKSLFNKENIIENKYRNNYQDKNNYNYNYNPDINFKKSFVLDGLSLNEEFINNNSFCSGDNLNIEDVKEQNFIPFIIINPIFEKKENIKVFNILNNSAIGYLDKDNHKDNNKENVKDFVNDNTMNQNLINLQLNLNKNKQNNSNYYFNIKY